MTSPVAQSSPLEAPRPQTSALITGLDGIDVSHFQGHDINWPRVASACISWAYCKASEGVTVTDDTYAGNMARGRAAGLRMGGYHFHRVRARDVAESDEDRARGIKEHAEEQADHFIDRLRACDWTPDDLPPAIDVEAKDGATDAEVALSTCIALRRVADALGVTPVLYTYANFARVFTSRPELAAFPLWLAAYQAREPVAPLPWTSLWAWQWSGKAMVPGVPTPCDRSRMVAALP